MSKLIPVLVISMFLVIGCATSPDKLPTTYISPLKYKKYDCDQLTEEIDHVSHRAAELYTSLDKKADNDAAQVGASIILWPTLLFLEGGDGPEATEYSNMKGEFEAIRVAMLRKKCSTEFMSPSPNEIVKAKAKSEAENEISEDDY